LEGAAWDIGAGLAVGVVREVASALLRVIPGSIASGSIRGSIVGCGGVERVLGALSLV
jgi:hypothetical protein